MSLKYDDYDDFESDPDIDTSSGMDDYSQNHTEESSPSSTKPPEPSISSDNMYHKDTYDPESKETDADFSDIEELDPSIVKMIKLVDTICEDTDRLSNYKEKFITFFKENNIDQSLFEQYDHKGFGKDIVSYFENKKLRGPSQKLFTALSRRNLNESSVSDTITKERMSMTPIEETKTDIMETDELKDAKAESERLKQENREMRNKLVYYGIEMQQKDEELEKFKAEISELKNMIEILEEEKMLAQLYSGKNFLRRPEF